MTLNWGHKLVIVFILFGTMIGYLVYRSVTTSYDLVSKEYYKDELAYQQVIDGTKRAGELSSAVTVAQEDDDIVIRFPDEMKKGSIKGQAWFYYAPDAQRDRKLPLESVGETEFRFGRSVFCRAIIP
jgi:FixH.